MVNGRPHIKTKEGALIPVYENNRRINWAIREGQINRHSGAQMVELGPRGRVWRAQRLWVVSDRVAYPVGPWGDASLPGHALMSPPEGDNQPRGPWGDAPRSNRE